MSFLTLVLGKSTKPAELVGKKEFAAAALDPGNEAFAIEVASLVIV